MKIAILLIAMLIMAPAMATVYNFDAGAPNSTNGMMGSITFSGHGHVDVDIRPGRIEDIFTVRLTNLTDEYEYTILFQGIRKTPQAK